MPLLANIPIRTKLMAAFGAIVLLTTLMGVLAVAINLRISGDMSQIRQDSTKNAEAVSAMAESLLELRLYVEELLNGRWAGQKENAKFIQGIADSIAEFDNALATTRQDTAKTRALAEREGNSKVVQIATKQSLLLDDIASKFKTLKLIVQNNLKNVDTRGVPTALWNDFDRVSDPVEEYEAEAKNQLGNKIEVIRKALHHTNVLFMAFAFLIMGIGSFLTWFIARTVSRPIGVLKAFAQRVGQGDLAATIQLPSRDEFGLLAATFNQMTGSLRSKTVSKDYVDSILRSMVNTLIVVRPDHVIQSVNAATVRLLGYPESELIGQSMDRVLQNPASRPRPLLDEALAEGFVSDVDVIYQARDGWPFPMTFSASTLRGVDGAVNGLVCVAQDISQRKKAERELERTHRRLLDTSRQAGMAEVATSVLHNVGNVLNSVNVSSALISEKVQHSKITSFSKAVAMIEEHRADLPRFLAEDEKGRMLPGYLSKLAVNLEHEQKELLQEVESLAKNVLHIKEVVATQQNYARVSGPAEEVAMADLLEDALRINSGALDRHGITVKREYLESPSVPVEKHKVLQILVNLISNAKYACESAEPGRKQITLRVLPTPDRIRVDVIDTGMGIPRENLSRIFSYGFTTKKEGHGFGLHSSALAAKEMGGTLTVASDGPGKGAVFTLELPLQQGKIP